MNCKLLVPLFLSMILVVSCSKTDSIRGNQSPMGEVGVTISSSNYTVDGVTNMSGEIIGLEDGISVYSGTATITNANYKNILSNFPGTEIDGDQVTITGLEFKQTDRGLEAVNALAEGIIVDYDSKVGDEYKTSDGVRTVTSKSTEDDFYWGGMLIKVTEVEETPNKFGVKKIVYQANHKFGLVGVEFVFDDDSNAILPVYTDAQN